MPLAFKLTPATHATYADVQAKPQTLFSGTSFPQKGDIWGLVAH